MFSDQGRQWPSTHWSDIGDAGHLASDRGYAALEKILRRYRPAFLTHLISKFRLNNHEADDALQAFLHEKILVDSLLAEADRQRGRFRTFILGALDNFVLSSLRHRRAVKRSPSGDMLPLQNVNPADAPIHLDSHPDRVELVWGQAVIAGALLNMHAELNRRGRLDIWTVFQNRVLRPILDDAPALPYEDLISQFGFNSPADAFNVLVTAKRMFRRHLRIVVAEYAKSDQEVEEELTYLRRVLERYQDAS